MNRYYSSRFAKTEYIDQLPKGQRPSAYVLGSSNVMRYHPETIEKYFGMKAFNYGVYWGRAEDFWAIASHLVKDLGERPEVFFVGTEVWTMQPVPASEFNSVFPGFRRMLLAVPGLAKHLNEMHLLKKWWAIFVDCFSGEQIGMCIDSLKKGKVRQPHPKIINENGTRTYYGDEFGNNTFQDVENGKYPITELLKKDGLNWRHTNIYIYDHFWEKRVRYFKDFVALCNQYGIKLVFIINPTHPLFRKDIMENYPQYLKNLKNLKELLNELKNKYAVVKGVVDVSSIESFAGDPEGFFDAIHPATRNCDLVLKKIYDQGLIK